MTLRAINRRRFLSLAGGALTLPYFAGCTTTSETTWREARRLAAMPRPVFPAQEWDIQQFGAKSDGVADASDAIAAAIRTCHLAGGGRVKVSAGVYLSGPIELLSNVELHLVRGARILFKRDPAAYLPPVPTRWEGMDIMGYKPLVYAYRQRNIAVTGEGVLDGQADRQHWWGWKGGDWAQPGIPTQDAARARLYADMEAGTPLAQRLYAEGSFLRPAFVQPNGCEQVLIEGITITNAPFWLLHPLNCSGVRVSRVNFASMGPNSDGCDPESCRDVVIEDCHFDTGDDCIAIKSGRNEDGRGHARPSENILIRRCSMRRGHGGVVIGSEMSGGVRNVFVEDCHMSSPELERGLRIKTNSVRGGFVQNVQVRRVTMGEVQTAIVVDFNYEEGDSGAFAPQVSHISIEGLRCERADQVFNIRGYARAPITQLVVRDCEFVQAGSLGMVEHAQVEFEQVYINGDAVSLSTLAS